MTYILPNCSSFFGIYINVGILSFLLTTLTMPLVAIFIGKRFDPLFKEKTMALNNAIGLNRTLRSSWYASVMLYSSWIKKRPHSTTYAIINGYNLWHYATKFERILACIHLLPAIFIGVPAVLIFWINHFIFYVLGWSH